MSGIGWIVIGAAALAACAGGRKRKTRRTGPGKGAYRIDHPHVVDPDDFECSVCGRRFRINTMACPYCGTRFLGRVTDEAEWMDAEEEMEAWDEEDGL